ncbi:MAG: 2-oxoglutarate dehydrogenase E1 component, partial [Deltaproteobacteria bacterium]|nr:2-oxoglutarate dehydrogenase E1 component [Deltaproteobacteria bacterium]
MHVSSQRGHDFFNVQNLQYLETLYERYQADPSNLEIQWVYFFLGLELGESTAERPTREISPTPSKLVEAYREFGHLIARLNPLEHPPSNHSLLELSNFDVYETDLKKSVGNGSFFGRTDGSLKDLLEKLRVTYCGSVGVEYMHITDRQRRLWLQQRMETVYNQPSFDQSKIMNILQQLLRVQEFERFLQTKYIGQKRFSLEGAEALIPLLNTLLETGAQLGIQDFVVGAAHRGRLNIMANVLQKPLEAIFAEFEETQDPSESEGDGDVRYHLGYSSDRILGKNLRVHCTLQPNPSHLELVDPIVEGVVRGKQEVRSDQSNSQIAAVLIHGDASYTGQGIVSETLQLSQLEGFRTGGTLHLIISNQVGFTTPVDQMRSARYPTDESKAIQAPIFHVNADDPSAVVHVAELAIQYRQEFKSDVFIDIWCYRKQGHNEMDDPTFTQPLMYQAIQRKVSVVELFATRALAKGIITETELDRLRSTSRHNLQTAFEKAKTYSIGQPFEFQRVLKFEEQTSVDTSVAIEVLRQINHKLRHVPDGFSAHPRITRGLQTRKEMGEGTHPIDWSCAEAWAMASLLLEKIPVRLTGQDTERGTFSQRHAVFHDQKNGQKYIPLSHLADDQAPFTVINTMLSELACLGFECGFSFANPGTLVLWEAQFGDFINMAQPIIDQFLSASESKWHLTSGIVLLLPHGFEGQGPEHSSARLERFLQLCAQNNLRVCYPTLPSQYFHLLRRQIKNKYQKPLIVMAPKSLLRHPDSVSKLEEFSNGGFKNVLAEFPAEVERILFCTGRVYFALRVGLERRCGIVRLEQLYP